jgi:hypothetical protein
MQMPLYPTLFISFIVGMLVIWISGKYWNTGKNWQSSLLALAGIVMIAVILWLLLQVLIGVPSLAQTVDLPAIFLGLLIAYGFQNAAYTLRERAKNKFK